MSEKQLSLPEVRSKLDDADKLIFFTGAGISAESGVPTYRGAGGIWGSYNYEEYACQDAFLRNPEAVWSFHNYRRELVAACAPNEGHRIIAQIEQERPCTVITQNIDGLHHAAGSKNILELHGSLWRVRCQTTGEKHVDLAVPFAARRDDGLWWRPDIIWFGDALDERVVDSAMQAAVQADVFISIGTSASVFPAAHLPVYAQQAGAFLIEINPEETPLSHVYHHLMRMSASDALGALFNGT